MGTPVDMVLSAFLVEKVGIELLRPQLSQMSHVKYGTGHRNRFVFFHYELLVKVISGKNCKFVRIKRVITYYYEIAGGQKKRQFLDSFR